MCARRKAKRAEVKELAAKKNNKKRVDNSSLSYFVSGGMVLEAEYLGLSRSLFV